MFETYPETVTITTEPGAEARTPLPAERFDAVRVEYAAARAGLAEAEARMQAAGRALLVAQCRDHYATTRTHSGTVRHECTLAWGHAGEHGKLDLP